MFKLQQRDGGSVPDRGPLLIAILWPLFGLALATVFLRVGLRLSGGKFGLADVFMILSVACMFGWSVSLTIFSRAGGERHITDVERLGLDTVALVQFLDWLSQVFGILGVAAGKISVSALLLSILRGTGLRWQQMYLWLVTIGLASAIAVSCSVLTMVQCSPPQALWDPRVQGRCIDSQVMSSYGIFTGSFNTFADGSLAILPVTMFWSLNTRSTLKRAQLCIVFGLNILTCICSGIKTQYLAQLANRADLTWATFDIFTWVTAELFLMIVCGTVPTLYPLLASVGSLVAKAKTALSRATPHSGTRRGSVASGAESAELVTVGRLRSRRVEQMDSRDFSPSTRSDYLYDGHGAVDTVMPQRGCADLGGKQLGGREATTQQIVSK